MTEPALGTRYFYKKSVQNEFQTRKQGKPVFDDRLYYKDLMPSDRNTVIDRRISDEEAAEIRNYFPRPDDSGDQRHHMQTLQKLLARFDAGESQTSEGTPLEQWPQITATQVKILRFHGIHSVETLTTVNDEALTQMGTGFLSLKKAASEFLIISQNTNAVNEQKELNEKLQSELDAVKAALAEMQKSNQQGKSWKKPKEGEAA